MENHGHHQDFGKRDEGAKREGTGNNGNLPMLGHVVSLLSALASIVGILSENLGKRK